MINQWLIAASILLVSCNAVLAADGLIIKQTGSLGGNHTIYVKPHSAIKISDQQTYISLIVKEPDWQPILVNARTKRWCKITKKVKSPFSNASLFMITGQDFNALNWEPSGSATVAGTPAVDYKALLLDLDTGKPTAKRPSHIYAMKEELVPKNAASAVCKFMSMPVVPTIPLKVTYANGAGSPVDVLETTSIQKHKLADSDFATPTNFDLRTKQEEVFRDPRSDDAIMDMVGAMGSSHK